MAGFHREARQDHPDGHLRARIPVPKPPLASRYNNAPMPFAIFYDGHYAIHGTDQIKKLGEPASRGCVRLHPDNARILFEMVKAEGMENMRVVIVQ
jgi:lipoprotein-anchoring transpeptidase ErfK/SrfK